MDAFVRVRRATEAPATESQSPQRPSGYDALELQRTAGNRAVSELVAGATAGPGALLLRQQTAAPPTQPQTPTPQQQADRDAAVATHQSQQQRVIGLIARGRAAVPSSPTELDADALFRNACEWIIAGRATMLVLSPTHDSRTRIAGRVAFFDRQVAYPNVGGTYAPVPDATDADHVYSTPPGFQGGMTHHAHRLELLDPAGKTDDELISTLIHEVQHDADLVGHGEPGASLGAPGLTGSAQLQSAGLFNDYQSEFRAHWVETPEGFPGDQYGSSRRPASNARSVPGSGATTGGPPAAVATAFVNERQERIFWWLVRNGYPYAAPYARDPAFKQMVDAFDRPMGVNVINSVRVAAVIDALGGSTPARPANDPAVRAVIHAFDALDSNDLVFLHSPDARPFWDYAARQLPPEVCRRLRFRASLPVEDYGPIPGDGETATA